MSDELALDLVKDDGSIEQERVPLDVDWLDVSAQLRLVIINSRPLPQLNCRLLVAVPDEIALLTRVERLFVSFASHEVFCDLTLFQLGSNPLPDVPAGVFAMTQLSLLHVSRSTGASGPHANALVEQFSDCHLTAIPSEIGCLTALTRLYVSCRRLHHVADLYFSFFFFPFFLSCTTTGS